MEKPELPSASSFAPTRFLQEVIAELKKVTWPTRQETVKLTGMVIIVSVIVAFFVGGLDAFFLSLTSKLLTR